MSLKRKLPVLVVQGDGSSQEVYNNARSAHIIAVAAAQRNITMYDRRCADWFCIEIFRCVAASVV